METFGFLGMGLSFGILPSNLQSNASVASKVMRVDFGRVQTTIEAQKRSQGALLLWCLMMKTVDLATLYALGVLLIWYAAREAGLMILCNTHVMHDQVKSVDVESTLSYLGHREKCGCLFAVSISFPFLICLSQIFRSSSPRLRLRATE